MVGGAGTKFDVTYLSQSDLEARLVPNPPNAMANIFTECMLEVTRGRFDFKDLNLNALFPDIKPMGLEEFLQKWWGSDKVN